MNPAGAAPPPVEKSMRILVVTGVSGAGKSTALRALEDVGFYCVDNLPLPLLSQFIGLLQQTGQRQAALVIDAREHRRRRLAEALLERLGHDVPRLRWHRVLQALELARVGVRQEAAHDREHLAELDVDPAQVEHAREQALGVAIVDARLPDRRARLLQGQPMAALSHAAPTKAETMGSSRSADTQEAGGIVMSGPAICSTSLPSDERCA